MRYLGAFCQQVQELDERIRFVGIADYGGKLLTSYYRAGLIPLMDRKETEQYALQTVFRARTRGGFKPQLGQQRYATAVYDRLIRTTVTVAHPEAEHHDLYLLISLDIGNQFPAIVEDKVIPFVSRNKDELFKRTMVVTEKYR